MNAEIRRYRLLTCLKCKHEFKSNLESKKPHCSHCGSFDWIESKQLVNKSKLEKEIESLKDYIFGLNAKVNQQSSTIDELVTGHNKLYDAYMELKAPGHPQPQKNKSIVTHSNDDKTLTMSEQIAALGKGF